MTGQKTKRTFKNSALGALTVFFALLLVACPAEEENEQGSPVIKVGTEGQPCRADLSCNEGLICVLVDGEDICVPVSESIDGGVIILDGGQGPVTPTQSGDGGTGETQPPDTHDAGGSEIGEEVIDSGVSAYGAFIGSEGGTLEGSGFELVVPPGALSQTVFISLAQNLVELQSTSATYSAQTNLEPHGLEFAIPAQIRLTHQGPEEEASIFQQEANGTYKDIGGVPGDQELTETISHLKHFIVANGIEFYETADLSSVQAVVSQGNLAAPSGVGLMARVFDETGVPVTDLDTNQFKFVENETMLVWPTASVIKKQPDRLFISILLDFSFDEMDRREKMVHATKKFLSQLHGQGVMASVAIKAFAKDGQAYPIVDFTLSYNDLLVFDPSLDTILAQPPPLDGAGRNLNGALLQAQNELNATIDDFRDLNEQGGLTTGHLVVMTTGLDTEATTPDVDLAPVFDGTHPVWFVALPASAGDLFYPEVYQPYRSHHLASDAELPRQLSRIAFEIKQHNLATYWIGYCSPSRSGAVNASITVIGSSTTSASSYAFNSASFEDGCTMETLTGACDDQTCGGFSCGSCDERGSSCQTQTGQCLSFCSQHCIEPGHYTNSFGYQQPCFNECDQDFIENDNCPFLTDTDLEDTDGDGAGNPCDSDDDNDTYLDEDDDCPRGTANWPEAPTASNDFDSDGCYDQDEDLDDDNDGVLDEEDNCAYGDSFESNTETDYDGDGCNDDLFEDRDDDNDGIMESPWGPDNCRKSANLGWVSSDDEDYDRDGCEDSGEDPDDDNDEVLDEVDECELGNKGWISDEDTTDHDSDGCEDDSNEDLDDDNDGVLDVDDLLCPKGDLDWVSNLATDYDEDGCQDSGEDLDDDNDGVSDDLDNCPQGMMEWEASETNDVDGDGCHDDSEDIDDDNDCVCDSPDNCPGGYFPDICPEGYFSGPDNCHYIGNIEQHNRDKHLDDLGDACDLDDDNDGLADESDDCPTGLVDWAALGEEDADLDGCRDPKLPDPVVDQMNEVEQIDSSLMLSAGDRLGQVIEPSAHGDLSSFHIYNLTPLKPVLVRALVYHFNEPIERTTGWDFQMATDQILFEDNYVLDVGDHQLDVYISPTPWVAPNEQLAMVIEILGEAELSFDAGPTGELVDGADGNNLAEVELSFGNKYTWGFFVDQGQRLSPTTTDMFFQMYFYPEEDLDDDNDNIEDSEDNCPFEPNPEQEDHEGDNLGDQCDPDDDNDDVDDGDDNCPMGTSGWTSSSETDNDNDGCRDDHPEDPDKDNDGWFDESDNCELEPNPGQENHDTDYEPANAKEGDACDLDDDRDQKPDLEDDCPLGALGWTSNSSTDYDNDGCQDIHLEDVDDDNDGVNGIEAPVCDPEIPDNTDCNCTSSPELCLYDRCPNGMMGWTSDRSTNDRDGDGCKDSDEEDLDEDGDLEEEDYDDDNDVVCDGAENQVGCNAGPDNCPYDPNTGQENFDADFEAENEKNGDACDLDDDNDGIEDLLDNCPRTLLIGWEGGGPDDLDNDGCHDVEEDADLDNEGDNHQV